MGIYLDNAATSYPKPKEVADAIYDFIVNKGGTAGRGAYQKALDSDYQVYQARKLISNFFNHDNPSSVIFTSNITESLNSVINGVLNENDHVIISSLEHNAVYRCLRTLERDKKISISIVECDKYGYTNSNDIEKYIKTNTKLIIFNHASNVLGTIQPIREIGNIAKDNNILFLVDVAQTAGAHNIDIKEDNIDILAFTGHKSLLGPMGIGGYILNCDHSLIRPFKSGGTGGDSAYPFQPDYLPNKFECGTPNIPGIIGLMEGIKFINKVGLQNIINKERELIDYTLNKLSQIKNINIYGPKDTSKILNVISFDIDNISSNELAYELDQEYEIMVRVGLHCAPTAHKIIGTDKNGTIRISIGYFNEKEDIDKLVISLNELIEKLT